MSQTDSKWLFEIKNQDSENPVRLLNATRRKVSIGVNQAGEASFDIDLNDTKAVQENLRPARSELYVYRDGELFFSGKIMIVQRVLQPNKQFVRVTALGWFYLLSKRELAVTSDLVYSSTDAGAIVLDLLNQTQSQAFGDLGILEGEIDISQNISITYTRQNVAEAIEELISQAGIEFEISQNKLLNVFYPLRGSDRSDLVIFKYPGNIRDFRSVDDATTIVNNEHALGKGIGSNEIVATRNDVGSQSVYGLFEKIQAYKAVDNVTTLGNMAEYDITLLKSPRLTLDLSIHGNLSPSLDDFGLGDSIRVKVNHDNYMLDQVFRVFEIHVTIDENDREDLRLIVALV